MAECVTGFGDEAPLGVVFALLGTACGDVRTGDGLVGDVAERIVFIDLL